MDKLRELLIANGINPNDAVQRGKFYREYFDWDTLAKRYESGSSIQDLCKETNLSYDTVRANLIRKGVKLRKRSFRGRHKYDFDIGSLINLNEKGTYLLGWILSDGHVSDTKLTITLQKKDKEHLKYLVSLFTDKPLREVKNGYSFDYYSVDLVKILREKYGIKKRKSHDNYCINFFDYGDLSPYLMLGLFEGDGSLSKENPSAQFLIPLKSYKYFIDYLKSRNVDVSHEEATVLNEHGLTSVNFSGVSYFSVLHFMYKNTSKIKPLKRKYDRFINQVQKSMNGRTSPYKSIARDVWYSLVPMET